jgi:hypothetical protein
VTEVCIRFNEDGMVIGPEWSVDRANRLVREMRKASPAPGDSDLLVLARWIHELFEERPQSRFWPTMARYEGDRSIYRALIDLCSWEEIDALYRAEPEDVLAASNMVRWVLQLPQQSSVVVVFKPLPDSEVVVPHQCSGRLPAVRRLASAG